MTRYATTDLHGCPQTFEAFLDYISLTKSDTLYLLGDYIHRGPDSVGVVNRILNLQESGYQVQCLMGNHEEMALSEMQKTLYNHGYGATSSDSYVVELYKTYGELPKQVYQFISGLETAFFLEDYILVHAGINFEAPDPFGDQVSQRWIRNWYNQIDKGLLGNRIILHGHTPITQEAMQEQYAMLHSNQYLDLDGGCVFGKPTKHMEGLGWLCGFNLDTQELIQIACRD